MNELRTRDEMAAVYKEITFNAGKLARQLRAKLVLVVAEDNRIVFVTNTGEPAEADLVRAAKDVSDILQPVTERYTVHQP